MNPSILALLTVLSPAVAIHPELPDAVEPALFQRVAAVGEGQAVLGIHVSPVDPALAAHLGIEPSRGILVIEVNPRRAAAKAGVQRYDVITHIDSREVASHDDLREAIASREPGDSLTLEVRRGDQSDAIEVALEEGSNDDDARRSDSEAALAARLEAVHGAMAQGDAARDPKLAEERAALEAMLANLHERMAETGGDLARLEAERAALAARDAGRTLEERLHEEHAGKHEDHQALHEHLLGALERQTARLATARDRIEVEAQRAREQIEHGLHSQLEALHEKLSHDDRAKLEAHLKDLSMRIESTMLSARDRMRMPLVEIAPGGAVIREGEAPEGYDHGSRFDAIEERLARIEQKLDELLEARRASDN